MDDSDWQDDDRCYCCTSRFKHKWGSAFAGFLFALGWIIWLDGVLIGARNDGFQAPPWYFYLPGIIATFVLLMMNIVSLNDLTPYSFMFSSDVSGKVRAWLFFTFVLGMGCLVASVWMCVDTYRDEKGPHIWPGVSLVLQNVAILLSSFIFLYAKKTDENESDFSMEF